MAAITYKCPNCAGNLALNPSSGKLHCDRCEAEFSPDNLQQKPASDDFNAKLYHCQACGAEVFTDDTTAATFCVYCHNPVVLSGELSGAMKPDQVIPFKKSKKTVEKNLMDWCRKKRFIDSRFFNQAQIEKLSGVYFPFFIVDGDTSAAVNKRGTKVKTWRRGDYVYTQTDTYAIARNGTVHFEDIPVSALNKEHTYILNGIQPYNQKYAVPFDMSYLSGFLADKRNIEKEDAQPEVERTANEFTQQLIDQSIIGYTTVTTQSSDIHITKTDYHYVLMPAWMLTYQFGGQTYYFAMNGATGKIAGRVPLSKEKLALYSCGIGLLAFIVMMIVGWFL